MASKPQRKREIDIAHHFDPEMMADIRSYADATCRTQSEAIRRLVQVGLDTIRGAFLRWGPPKLVRDGVLAIIRSKGEEPHFRKASKDEFRTFLRQKLIEEVLEFLESDDPAELIDVAEVVIASAADFNIDQKELERRRLVKLRDRGGFDERIIWLGNEPVATDTELTQATEAR